MVFSKLGGGKVENVFETVDVDVRTFTAGRSSKTTKSAEPSSNIGLHNVRVDACPWPRARVRPLTSCCVVFSVD